MIESRQYRGLDLEIVKAKSSRVCYFLLPEGLKSDGLKFLEEAVEKYQCSMVVVSGFNWNDALTPWPAPGVFKEKKPFGGKADIFLKELKVEYIRDIEQSLGVIRPERYLVGVSLSGLFALWALTQTTTLQAVAAISPSLWYDNFVEWLSTNQLPSLPGKVHISLGDKEKNSKDPRMSTVESCTERVVEILRQQSVDVDYQLFHGTHFSPIVPRLEMALNSIMQKKI